MARYALIDISSGAIFNVIDAETPEAAAWATDRELGNEKRKYERVAHPSQFAANQTGYFVYEVPADFDCDDGIDKQQIEAVKAHPLVASLRSIKLDVEEVAKLIAAEKPTLNDVAQITLTEDGYDVAIRQHSSPAVDYNVLLDLEDLDGTLDIEMAIEVALDSML